MPAGSPFDDAALLRATAANHRAWFRRGAALAGGRVERCDGLDLIVSGRSATIAFPAPASRERLRARLGAAMTRAGELGVRSLSCWALREDRRLGTLLLARGFEWGWEPHWMACDLASLPDDGPSAWHAVGVVAGDAAAHVEQPRDLPYAGGSAYPAAARHLAVVEDGRVAGHVVVHPWRGIAGIYDMGVVPARRGHGIGRALTLAACRVARDALGCSHAVLNATGEGTPLYRGAGFLSLGFGRTWWTHPGPVPTARQAALVEAIGFGETDALAALAAADDELEAEIPGGGPPLAVAVVTGQAGAADWILTRRPDLVSRPVEPRGGTLLHVAVEWDDEALVAVALAHGADRGARDSVWHATPLEWAEHLGRPRLGALLRGA